jgi:hypothetical protein
VTLKKLLFKSLFILIVVSGIFLIHVLVNNVIEVQFTVGGLLYAYIINLILAFLVIYVLFILKKRLKDQLGFVFMVASLFKFVAFFILFYPKYNSDGDLSQLEFFTFFIPYAVCLTLECIVLSKILNGLDTYN